VLILLAYVLVFRLISILSQRWVWKTEGEGEEECRAD
jgi:hypothetical protein